MSKSNSVQISWQLPKCDSCGAQVHARKMPYGIVSECPNRKWFDFWAHHRQQLSWEENDRYFAVGSFQIDRAGVLYNIVVFITAVESIRAPYWFDGYAAIPAFISQVCAFALIGHILGQWQRERFRKKS